MPAPIAPWISASEALTIWMLSTAMKAPSVAPMTAIQVLAEIAGSAFPAATCGGWPPRLAVEAFIVGWSAVMGSPLAQAEAECIRRAGPIIGLDMEGLPGRTW